MKLYITARFKGIENKSDIEELCRIVHESGVQDFCFIRDIENYQRIFTDIKELWSRTKTELKKCDALLIDVTDAPSGGRVIEAGMAYALNIPIIVIVKYGAKYNPHYDGISSQIITYTNCEDITAPLREYLENQV